MFDDEGHEVYGVVGITVAEAEAIGFLIQEDRQPYPSHISLAFPDCSNKEIRRMAKAASAYANSRGWLYINPLCSERYGHTEHCHVKPVAGIT